MNTIYDGTFVLGNTSATTYQAGNGISITQPSEGTVRISNDETVLWSGTAAGNITLSEPCTNFEKLELTTKNNEVITIKVAEKNFSLIFCPAANTDFGFFSFVNFTLSGSNITTNVGQVLNAGTYNAGTPTMTWDKSASFKSWCVKVVGINRISGSNT